MRMADLRVEVPLADDTEFSDFGGQSMMNEALTSVQSNTSSNVTTTDSQNNNCITIFMHSSDMPDSGICSETESILGGSAFSGVGSADAAAFLSVLGSQTPPPAQVSEAADPDFCEVGGMGGSLEDLVNCFDENVSKCFKNYTENTDKIAPVQVRTQEEIMSECQIWWTLTGNFGNILPIDWSKSYSRKMQLPVLNVQENEIWSKMGVKPGDEMTALHLDDDSEDEDEELARALDMHSLILTPNDLPPPQTAEQVIQEIDEIMLESSTSDATMESSGLTMDSSTGGLACFMSPVGSGQGSFGFGAGSTSDAEMESRIRETTLLAKSPEKLSKLSYSKLQTLHAELESLIQLYNESLVAELALRDELEYEKELKNTFISLILNIQNKRRQYLQAKRGRSSFVTVPISKLMTIGGQSFQSSSTNPTSTTTAGPDAGQGKPSHPQYLTAVIPYEDEAGPPDTTKLQALIKILHAVQADNPQVPTLLTDYILNVLCPSNSPRPPMFLA